MHSARLWSLVLTTDIVLGGIGEQLIMRHDPGLTFQVLLRVARSTPLQRANASSVARVVEVTKEFRSSLQSVQVDDFKWMSWS
jgi:hypothetical protein